MRFDECHPTAQLLPHDAADESSYTGTQHQQVITGGVFALSLQQLPAVLIGHSWENLAIFLILGWLICLDHGRLLAKRANHGPVES